MTQIQGHSRTFKDRFKDMAIFKDIQGLQGHSRTSGHPVTILVNNVQIEIILGFLGGQFFFILEAS